MWDQRGIFCTFSSTSTSTYKKPCLRSSAVNTFAEYKWATGTRKRYLCVLDIN